MRTDEQASVRDEPELQRTKLLTLSQVAELIGVSRRTVDLMIATDELPRPIRLSERVVRIRASDLEAFLDSKSRQAHRG